MNASLNVYAENLPINSWEDLLSSNYNLLIWQGTAAEDQFKSAPNFSILNKLYYEKILTVPEENHLQNIGYHGALQYILRNEAVAFVEFEPYSMLEEYPCQITYVKGIK